MAIEEKHKVTKVLRNSIFKKAFSVMELMFALVAVSIVIAAATPLVSRHMRGDISLSKQKLSSDCKTIQADGSCVLCLLDRKVCVVCDKTCTAPLKKQESTCTCVN